jgi:hypothetical protein
MASGGMNLKLTALAALLLAPEQAMAGDIRVDCVQDQRIVCRDDEATCREPFRSRLSFSGRFAHTPPVGSGFVGNQLFDANAHKARAGSGFPHLVKLRPAGAVCVAEFLHRERCTA